MPGPTVENLKRAAEFRACAVAYCNNRGGWIKGIDIVIDIGRERPDLVTTQAGALKMLRDLGTAKLLLHKSEGRTISYKGRNIVPKEEDLYGAGWRKIKQGNLPAVVTEKPVVAKPQAEAKRVNGTDRAMPRPEGMQEMPTLNLDIDFIPESGKVEIAVPGLRLRIGIVRQ